MEIIIGAAIVIIVVYLIIHPAADRSNDNMAPSVPEIMRELQNNPNIDPNDPYFDLKANLRDELYEDD